MSRDSPLLEARGIGRRHGDGPDWLLRNISLTIGEGDRVALTGPTGSGKTVFLRALAMLDAVDEGAILWQGETSGADEVPKYRSQTIYLTQRARLFDGTVEKNLQLAYSLAVHRDRAYSREKIVASLQRLGRDDRFLALESANLSGGETQLVALLRAVQLDPAVLLLDEPTASLDEVTTRHIERLVADWVEAPDTRRAFVWVTHDPAQSQRVANRAVQLRDGHFVELEASR